MEYFERPRVIVFRKAYVALQQIKHFNAITKTFYPENVFLEILKLWNKYHYFQIFVYLCVRTADCFDLLTDKYFDVSTEISKILQ